MRDFLDQLFTTGQVTVPVPGMDFELFPEFEDQIEQFDQAARAGMAGDAPALQMDCAVWAAHLLAGAARLAIARDMGEPEVFQVLEARCPARRSAETDYSADLFLRYLPDLLGWMARLASGDPLVQKLRQIAGRWPLSSVGVRDLKIESIEPFIGNDSLCQLYVDRILASQDASRLQDPRAAAAVREALGAHPELSPVLARAVAIQT